MWHTIDHDAFAMIDTRNIASAAKDNCCFAGAIVDHEFDSRHTTARFNAHAFDFSGKFCSGAHLRVSNIDKVIFFESLAESL